MELNNNFNFNSKAAWSVVLVVILAYTWKIIDKFWWRPKSIERSLRKQGLKGTRYRLWSGDLEEMTKQTTKAQSKPIDLSDDLLSHAVPFTHHIIQKYGKKSFFWYGASPVLVLVDPEMIREVLSKNDVFTKEFKSVSLFVTGLAFHEGKKWAKHRRILNSAFHLKKLKVMLPAMSTSCEEMVREWEKLVGREGRCEVDVWPWLEKFTADVISRTAFGSSYEKGEMIFLLLKQQAQLAHQFYQAKWRFLQIKKLKELGKEIQNNIRDIIQHKLKAMEGRGSGEVETEDLLSLLLESSSAKDIKDGINIEDIIDECKLFYFAGQETTANLLAWTMVMLGVHQDWQTRARDEVFQVFGNERPHFEGLHRLKIVTMILYEVLRLYPPAIKVKRAAKRDTKLGDLTISAGLELEMPIICMHHDTDLWGDDANQFKPDRFAEGVAKVTKDRPMFIPFASGPRVCLGQNFAMIESKLALALILQHFSFELSPSYEHAPFPIMTLQPRYGVKMILQKI